MSESESETWKSSGGWSWSGWSCGRFAPRPFAGLSTANEVTARPWQLLRAGPWKVCVPAGLPPECCARLLREVECFGPAYAGLVRVQDAYVPASLSPEEARYLANAVCDEN